MTNGGGLWLGGLAAGLRYCTTNEAALDFAYDARGNADAGPSKTQYFLPQLPAERAPHQLVANHLMRVNNDGSLRLSGVHGTTAGPQAGEGGGRASGRLGPRER